jgi:hypothetical protein
MAINKTLTIRAKSYGQGSRKWGVTVSLDGEHLTIGKDIIVRDPLSESDDAECQWYFNTFVKDPFRLKRAAIVEQSLLDYARSLFDQLALEKVASRLRAQLPPKN